MTNVHSYLLNKMSVTIYQILVNGTYYQALKNYFLISPN